MVEDVARMHKQDANLARQLKQLRHQLTQALATIDSASLLQARDPASDVGTNISTTTEYQRSDWDAMIRSNFSRVLQSLRTIEEYSKFLADTCDGDTTIARQLEQLRYQTYELEKAVCNTLDSRSQLQDVWMYVLTDARQNMEDFVSLVRSLIQADVCLIQLRDKNLDDRELIRRGRLLTELTRNVRTRWIMNDRPDVALLSNADGVHVGQEDLSVHEARQILGPGKLIGVSTHDIDQARAAERAGANYIGIGPVFPSGTKSFNNFVSADVISQVVKEISIPAFAIGGIDDNNIDQLAQLGVTRVAVSKSVVDSGDRLRTVQKMKDLLRAASLLS